MKNKMTVKELREKLNKYDDDTIITLEITSFDIAEYATADLFVNNSFFRCECEILMEADRSGGY